MRLLTEFKKWLTEGWGAVTAALSPKIEHWLEASSQWMVANWKETLFYDAVLSSAAAFAGYGEWALWAHVLIAQNFAFTFVSRARNSASIMRHIKAGFFSNGVWFASQAIIISKLFDYVQGKFGVTFAVATGLFYTLLTLTGSVLAHAFALKTEKGKSAVGANKKYAQIPCEEWAALKAEVARLSGKEPQVVTDIDLPRCVF